MELKEKRLVRYFALLALSLIFFVILNNFASAAITIVSPASNTNWSGSTLVVFNVSYTNITDFTSAINATFYYNLSGSWTPIGFSTKCVYGTLHSCNATLNISGLTDGRYSINATLSNTTHWGAPYGASAITTNIVFDKTPPNVSAFYNTVNNGNYSGTITLNVSVSDAGMGVDAVYFNITNSGGIQVNFSRAAAAGGYYSLTLVTSGLADGKYNVTVYANDTQLNNLNKTERIQITIDNIAPTVSLSKSSSTTSSIVVSYSCNDATSGVGSCTLSSPFGTVSGSTISGLGCGGVYTITVSAQDNAGNTASSSGSFLTENCGGGVTIPSLPKKIHSFTLITPGAAAIVKDFDTRIGVKEIQINVNNKAQNVKITVTKHDGKPAEVSVAKSGTVYQYIQIDSQNLNENLDGAVVQFRVEKSWIASNNLQKEDIAVHRFDTSGNRWEELKTTYKSEGNTYYYYDVELNSFSYFAIGEKTKEAAEEKITIETLTKNYLWVWIIIVVILAIIFFFLFKVKKKKK